MTEKVTRTGGAIRRTALVVGFLVACGEDPRTPPADGAAAPPAVFPDGSVAVEHERELRGAWISTVYNGTWPSRTGLSPADAQRELVAIFDALASVRMNAVFFQVRAESDAIYASTREPWSRFLTGTQGRDPGWDPLAFAVEEGHRRGLEVHAWLNPYRAAVDARVTPAPDHVTRVLATATRAYGTQLWMDPGVPSVRRHILEVVRDVVDRYDVDGIHYDDYFYPYPVSGETFDDVETFAAYRSNGGSLHRDDWRRENVDALVRETAALVHERKAWVRFGISPFGIYRPGTPPGITGLDAFATLYCDPVKWMAEGWVDYLAPQLYWPTTQTAQAFGRLVGWWATLAGPTGRSIFVGHDATKAGEGAFTLDEYDAQLRLTRDARPNGVRGSIFFSAKPVVTDQAGLRSALTRQWSLAAATPPLATAPKDRPPPPTLRRVGASGPDETIAITTTSNGTPARAVAVYAANGDPETLRIDRLVPVVGNDTEVVLSRGRWLVSLLDREGRESRGIRRVVGDLGAGAQ